MRTKFIRFLVVYALFAGVLSAEDNQPVPSGAVAPLRKFEAARIAADAERNKAVEKARAVMVAELKVSQKAAIQKDDVQGATALAEMAKLNEEGSLDRAALIGTAWQTSGNFSMTLLQDGTIKHSDPAQHGHWAVIGSRSIVVIVDNGFVDVWKFDKTGKRVHAEAYKRSNEYEAALVSRQQ